MQFPSGLGQLARILTVLDASGPLSCSHLKFFCLRAELRGDFNGMLGAREGGTAPSGRRMHRNNTFTVDALPPSLRSECVAADPIKIHNPFVRPLGRQGNWSVSGEPVLEELNFVENLPVLVVPPIPQKESITFMELQIPTPKFEELPHLCSGPVL